MTYWNTDLTHPADNFVMTEWTRLSNSILFNQVPFGVYAFTKPMDYIPSNNILPFNLEETIYFGKSGNSYDDFFYDRKKYDPIEDKERFQRYSLVESRLRSHRTNLRRDSNGKKEASYQRFYDIYGRCDDNTIDKMNVCVVIPKHVIPNFQVTAWTLYIESYFILLYQQKFGKNTLMNVGHEPHKKVEDSRANLKKIDVRNSSLEGFFA